jgi:hypothetical protein
MKRYEAVRGLRTTCYRLVQSYSGVQEFFVLPATASYLDVARYGLAKHSCVIKYSTYQYIPVCTGMCCYILWNFGRGKPRLGGLTVKESLRRLPCARKLCERTKPIVLLRLVGAGGRTERDPMKCAGWFPSVPVRTSMYQYVLVCTMNRLNLSSF